jgi:hypothetical protein
MASCAPHCVRPPHEIEASPTAGLHHRVVVRPGNVGQGRTRQARRIPSARPVSCLSERGTASRSPGGGWGVPGHLRSRVCPIVGMCERCGERGADASRQAWCDCQRVRRSVMGQLVRLVRFYPSSPSDVMREPADGAVNRSLGLPYVSCARQRGRRVVGTAQAPAEPTHTLAFTAPCGVSRHRSHGVKNPLAELGTTPSARRSKPWPDSEVGSSHFSRFCTVSGTTRPHRAHAAEAQGEHPPLAERVDAERLRRLRHNLIAERSGPPSLVTSGRRPRLLANTRNVAVASRAGLLRSSSLPRAA